MTPEIIWILGGGQFGQRAVQLLRSASPSADIVVVEKEPVPDLSDEVEFVCADAVEWLVANFVPNCEVTKIIPAVPLHLAAEWIMVKLADGRTMVQPEKIPDELFNRFPHPFRLAPGHIAMSYADFLCPPDCSEPAIFCSYTKKKRPLPLYSFLREIDSGTFTPFIVRSRQFAPGVGGFFPEDLWGLLKQVRQLPETRLLVGTACKCHGVVSGFSYQE